MYEDANFLPILVLRKQADPKVRQSTVFVETKADGNNWVVVPKLFSEWSESNYDSGTNFYYSFHENLNELRLENCFYEN